MALAACFGLLTSASSRAQSLPAGITLGMSEAAVHTVVPDLQRVRRPAKAPGGASGLWRQSGVDVGPWRVDQTFFFDAEGLRQVEWLLLSQPGQDGATSFAELVQGLRSRYGNGLIASQSGRGFVQESASWVADDVDMVASRSGSPDQPTVRMVWRQRVTKDASEL